MSNTSKQIVRWGVPSLIFAAGIVVLIFRNGDSIAVEVAAMTTGSTLSLLLIGWLVRLGNRGDEERQAESRARQFFDQHGRWPDDP